MSAIVFLRILPVLAVALVCLLLPALAQEAVDSEAAGGVLDPAVPQRLDGITGFEPETAAESAALLREILAHEKYTAEGFSEAGPSVFDRIIDWLQRLLPRFNLLPGSSITVQVLTVLVVLVVAYLIFRLIWELVQRRAQRESVGVESRPEDMTADALLLAAEQCARSGDYRTAIRWRFLALVKQLDLPAATVLTNSQLTRRVRKTAAAAAGPFAAAAGSFEDVWYGGLDCGPASYEQLSRSAEEAGALWRAALAAESAEAAG